MTLLWGMLVDRPGGLWTLAGVVDETGNGNTLTEVSAPPRVASIIPSVSTQAIDFDGAADTVWAADNPTLDLGDVFTLEAWIQIDVPGADSIITKQTSYQLYTTAGGVLGLARPSVAVIATSTVVMLSGRVYHCVATKNGSDVHLYINSDDVTGIVTNSTFTDGTRDLFIGSTELTELFDGRMQYAAVYPTALSAARVRAHYVAGVDVVTPLATTPFPIAGRGASW